MEKKDKKIKILIVDDDQFLLDMYSIKFVESGFDVTVALSSESAIEKLKNGSIVPNVILLDMVMPALEGIGFLEEMRNKKICKETIVVVLSNLGEPHEIERAKKYRINDYIVKASLTPSEVVERVRSLLQK